MDEEGIDALQQADRPIPHEAGGPVEPVGIVVGPCVEPQQYRADSDLVDVQSIADQTGEAVVPTGSDSILLGASLHVPLRRRCHGR